MRSLCSVRLDLSKGHESPPEVGAADLQIAAANSVINESELLAAHWQNLPRAWQAARTVCQIRSTPDDFRVTEIPAFEPTGDGEHLFLWIRKRGVNTDWLGRQLAKRFSVKLAAIGYAGKKDRHAVTEQWVSVHLPGQDADTDARRIKSLDIEGCEILRWTRHQKKLRPGNLKGNRFELTLRALTHELDEQLLQRIEQEGVPNYFGEQRFGYQGNNLIRIKQLVERQVTRKQKVPSILLSAARSFLFNQLLASRVVANCWNRPVAGDCFSLVGSHSFFQAGVDETILKRLACGDITISGWLAGQGASAAADQAQRIEEQVNQQWAHWVKWLEAVGVKSARRPFVVRPTDLRWSPREDNAVDLRFQLPAGSYATAVLREIADYCDQRGGNTDENTDQ